MGISYVYRVIRFSFSSINIDCTPPWGPDIYRHVKPQNSPFERMYVLLICVVLNMCFSIMYA